MKKTKKILKNLLTTCADSARFELNEREKGEKMAKRTTRTTKISSPLTAKENAMLTFIKEWEERQKEKEAAKRSKRSKSN